MRYDWRIVETIENLIKEGEDIIQTHNSCKAECWVRKSKFLMDSNWDIILRYQGSRGDNISRLMDELANVTMGVMDVTCECEYMRQIGQKNCEDSL